MDESNKVAAQDAKTDSKTEALDSTLESSGSQLQPQSELKAENPKPVMSDAAKTATTAIPADQTVPKPSDQPAVETSEKLAPKVAEKTSERTATRKKLMNTGNELKKALDSWNQLAKEPLPPSPNEQMLNDVKDLLKQLKDKIEEFK